MGGVVAAIAVFLILAIVAFIYRRKFQDLKLLYTDVDIPESPGYKPNMSRLRYQSLRFRGRQGMIANVSGSSRRRSCGWARSWGRGRSGPSSAASTAPRASPSRSPSPSRSSTSPSQSFFLPFLQSCLRLGARMNPESEKEMLDEATNMGAMDHPHLVRLVGICVSDNALLVHFPSLPFPFVTPFDDGCLAR